MSELVTEHQQAQSRSSLGFWIYLMTDCVLFASLFATYAVLRANTNGGPGAAELFSQSFVLTETVLLLLSSYTCGLAMVAAHRSNGMGLLRWLIITFLLGLGFLGMELYEFQKLVHEGAGWQSSAFLSAFFTLVGTHGLHIFVGLIWVIVMVVRLIKHGLEPRTLGQLRLFSMFWHFLDVIWIFIFTIVYLFGALQL